MTLKQQEIPDLRKAIHSWRKIAGEAVRQVAVAAAIGAAAAVVRSLVPPVFAASAAFLPQSPNTSAVGSIAAQLGLDAPVAAGETPEFYIELLGSRPILRRVIDQPCSWSSLSGEERPLLQYLEGDTTELARERAIKRLRRSVRTSFSRRSHIVSLEVRLKGRECATLVAAALLREIDEFNRASRQTRSRAERFFLADRLQEAREAQMVAERDLTSFLLTNRRYADFPATAMQFERLSRLLSDHRTLVATLRQSFERARLEEVRDTPVISIIQPPYTPMSPEGLGPLPVGILTGLVVLLGLRGAAHAHRIVELLKRMAR
jgi:uncharacterized protein involved in exopolysaccharide biosynthesis